MKNKNWVSSGCPGFARFLLIPVFYLAWTNLATGFQVDPSNYAFNTNGMFYFCSMILLEKSLLYASHVTLVNYN